MLNRLFRDGLEDIVMRYETLRTAMAQEAALRKQQQVAAAVQQQQQHQHLRQVFAHPMAAPLPTARITEIPAEAAQEVKTKTAAYSHTNPETVLPFHRRRTAARTTPAS